MTADEAYALIYALDMMLFFGMPLPLSMAVRLSVGDCVAEAWVACRHPPTMQRLANDVGFYADYDCGCHGNQMDCAACLSELRRVLPLVTSADVMAAFERRRAGA